MKHNKIKFFKTPLIWTKNKLKVGLNQPNMFLVAIIPGVFGIFGLISNVITIFNINPDNINITLLWFLFVYGFFISVLILSHQRVNFRMNRDRKIFKIIHKDIAEKIREYLTRKREKELSIEDIEIFIRGVLNSINNNLMKVLHSNAVSIAVKYKANEYLYPIRVGNDIDIRDPNSEQLNNSPVYKALNKDGKKRRYIYVKDIDKPDNCELKVLGDEIDDIRARSKNKYNTFIALPIRAGGIYNKEKEITTRKDLGIIGFDLIEKYGFGNFDEYELDILGCLTDLLSEPIYDLIEIKNN